MRGHDSLLVTLAEPGGGRGNRLGRGLDDCRSIGDTGHMCLLERIEWSFPLKETHSYACSLPASSSLRIASELPDSRKVPQRRNSSEKVLTIPLEIGYIICMQTLLSGRLLKWITPTALDCS
jgi:hypothetical protein